MPKTRHKKGKYWEMEWFHKLIGKRTIHGGMIWETSVLKNHKTWANDGILGLVAWVQVSDSTMFPFAVTTSATE